MRQPIFFNKILWGATAGLLGLSGVACISRTVDKDAYAHHKLITPAGDADSVKEGYEEAGWIAPPTPTELQAATAAAQRANVFGFALLQNLHQQKPGENFFISPVSLTQALGMTYGGASGQTATEMGRVLRVGDVKTADAGYAALQKSLKSSDADVTVSIANALWVNPQFSFKPDFAARCSTVYGASVSQLPASPDAAAKQINNWVTGATNGLITQLVTRQNLESASGVLTNAVYFKGGWTTPFQKTHTRPRPFRPEKGQPYTIPMMQQTGRLGYFGPEPAENGIAPAGVQGVCLRYGKQREWAMYVFLPEPGKPVGTFLQTVTAENWNKWQAAFQWRLVDVSLPRFKAELGGSVKGNLSALGMPTAFSRSAQFPGMFQQPVPFYLGDVIHKTALKVTEEETEAAAATAVIAAPGAAAPPRQVIPVVVFDRPFVCLIVHQPTGAVAFAGVFYQPTPNP